MKKNSFHMGIKMPIWFAIFFIAGMSCGGHMPFAVYFIVVFLCFFANSVIDRISGEKEDDGAEDQERPDDKTE